MSETTDPTSYAQMMRSAVARRPEADAVVFPGRRVTYRQLMERAEARSVELMALGVGPGDNYGLLLPNSIEFVEFFVGASLFGAVTVPINTRYKCAELEHVIRDGELVSVVTTDAIDQHTDFKQLLSEALPGLATASEPRGLAIEGFPKLRTVAVLGATEARGFISEPTLRELAADRSAPSPEAAPGPDEPLFVMYTSGTTAAPKGCVQANGPMVSNVIAVAHALEIPSDDRWWDPLPMFHMGAVLLMSAAFSRGAAFVSMSHFEASAAVDLIVESEATVLYPLFPTITLALMHESGFGRIDLDRVRLVGSVGPPELQRRIQEAFAPARLISAYGMTELAGTLAYSRLSDTEEQRITTCGHVLPGWEVRVIDSDRGVELPSGRVGELVVRGRSLFRGYHGSAEATDDSFDDSGFFHTGDLCSLDEDGLLSFHGRFKDVLKVGGENVSALEVESFLAGHPAVELAQVVGVPDDHLVEVPAAFIELAPGRHADEEELIEFCRGRIAGFKVPRFVRFVTEWPMSSTKVQKFKLRESLIDELGR